MGYYRSALGMHAYKYSKRELLNAVFYVVYSDLANFRRAKETNRILLHFSLAAYKSEQVGFDGGKKVISLLTLCL